MNKKRNTVKFLCLTGMLAGIIAGSTLLAGCTDSAARTATTTALPVESASAGAQTLPTITVNATSEVAVVPDKAEIGVAVTTEGKTPQEVQAQNAEAINAVSKALKDHGVDEKSIQTTDTYLNPVHDYSDTIAMGTDTGERIVGYEMTTRLSIKDLAIEEVGAILQACVDAGATNTDGISYYSSEYDTKYAEALAAAIDKARAKADVLAGAAGVKLGGVYSISEGYQNTAYRYDTAAKGVAMEAASDEMNVNPGEINIEANITVSYEIL